MNEFIHRDYVFELAGDHPHKGERCWMVGESKDTITHNFAGYLVQLQNCIHGSEQCYAQKNQLRLLKEVKEHVY
jgi:hypothetical protein